MVGAWVPPCTVAEGGSRHCDVMDEGPVPGGWGHITALSGTWGGGTPPPAPGASAGGRGLLFISVHFIFYSFSTKASVPCLS